MQLRVTLCGFLQQQTISQLLQHQYTEAEPAGILHLSSITAAENALLCDHGEQLLLS